MLPYPVNDNGRLLLAIIQKYVPDSYYRWDVTCRNYRIMSQKAKKWYFINLAPKEFPITDAALFITWLSGVAYQLSHLKKEIANEVKRNEIRNAPGLRLVEKETAHANAQ